MDLLGFCLWLPITAIILGSGIFFNKDSRAPLAGLCTMALSLGATVLQGSCKDNTKKTHAKAPGSRQADR